MYVGVCVSEGRSRGGQSPIRSNFSFDYMNWLSVLAEARHAGPSAANLTPSNLPNPDASLTHVTVLKLCSAPDLLDHPGPSSPLKLSR